MAIAMIAETASLTKEKIRNSKKGPLPHASCGGGGPKIHIAAMRKIAERRLKMSLLDIKGVSTKALEEGNYELTLISFREVENERGGYVETVFAEGDIKVTHCIFPKSIDYTINTLGQQVEKYGELTLEDVLIPGFKYHIYVSYNEYGRNISFGMRRQASVTENNDVAPF